MLMWQSLFLFVRVVVCPGVVCVVGVVVVSIAAVCLCCYW